MEFSVFSPVRCCTGYSYVARGFLKEWHNQGHDIALSEFKEWSNYRGATDIDPILEEYEKNTAKIAPPIVVNFCLIDQCRMNLNGLNVCYTMFEADKIPEVWVKQAEKLDIVFVPSEFSRKTFIKSGISSTKVFVCSPPLDLNKIRAQKPVPLFAFDGTDVMKFKHRFLNCSEYLSRKNIDTLIRAWCEESKDTDDACLILKLNSNSGVKLDFFQKKINTIIAKKKCAPIYILTSVLSETQMLQLYHSCTHYISTSYGEGWGLSESICGLLGKTLLVPKSTSFMDYLDDTCAYMIMTQPVGASQDGPVGHYYQGAKWFAPIFFSVRKNIRKAINDGNSGDFTKASLVAQKIEAVCNPQANAAKMLEIISEFKPSRAIKPTVMKADTDYNFLTICKSLGSKCGIADYTLSLFKGLSTDENKKYYSNSMLIRGESVEYSGILDQNNLHLTNLQLEYQFISPLRLKLFLEYHKNTNVIPTVTMHTVNPRAFDYHEVLTEYETDIIVSSNLMARTLVDKCGFSKSKVHVIPMGISTENVVTPESRKDGKIRIGFFGLCYPHKGINHLLNYMSTTPVDRECLIISSKPENDSGYFDKIYGLHQQKRVPNTQWITDFLDESSIVNALSSCDVIFLPYSSYGGVGVSAAIRTCIKAGVPIVAFENEFFKDVVLDSGLVTFLGDNPNNVKQWTDALNDYVSNINEFTKQSFLVKRDRFMDKYNWNEIAREHLVYFNSLLKEKYSAKPLILVEKC